MGEAIAGVSVDSIPMEQQALVQEAAEDCPVGAIIVND